MTPLTILFIGLLLGIRHATDADHIVAVSTIVSQQKKLTAAGIAGALWGLGHTIMVFVVGGAVIFFHVVIPPRVGLFFEFAVALMLIVLGVLNLTGFLAHIIQKLTPSSHPHSHLHVHDRNPHIHIHTHDASGGTSLPEKTLSLSYFVREFGLFHLVRPVVIGIIHGLAGSAAITLLILPTIRSPHLALAYLLVFGMGTVIGMVLITTLLGVPIVMTSNRFARANRYIVIASGLVSVALGLFMAIETGVAGGLFSASPHGGTP